MKINFIINTSPQRSHLVISDIVGGWDGTPTIKLLNPDTGYFKKKNLLKLGKRSKINTFFNIDDYGDKCLGHGQKLTDPEVFAFCEACKGPICQECYLSFDDLCPGSLFGKNHFLPESIKQANTFKG